MSELVKNRSSGSLRGGKLNTTHHHLNQGSWLLLISLCFTDERVCGTWGNPSLLLGAIWQKGEAEAGSLVMNAKSFVSFRGGQAENQVGPSVERSTLYWSVLRVV